MGATEELPAELSLLEAPEQDRLHLGGRSVGQGDGEGKHCLIQFQGLGESRDREK